VLVLLIIIAAPIVQIILSTLRVKGHIGLPIGGIMSLTFLLGIVLSVSLMSIIPPYISPSGFKCATGAVTVAIGSIFIQMLASPIIGIISYLAYRIKTKNDQKLSELSVIN
jgi:hypothetical protein